MDDLRTRALALCDYLDRCGITNIARSIRSVVDDLLAELDRLTAERDQWRDAALDNVDEAVAGEAKDAQIDRLTAILAEIDTPHAVVLTEDSWFIEHDIACRRAGMSECEINKAMSAMDSPPGPPGRYLATYVDGNLSLTAENESWKRRSNAS